ncbi:polyprenyl synthetase family protein [Streptomyces sp. T-3]|nr:polyprenyl synthetase family protein [Streptomyces sp. T-3]
MTTQTIALDLMSLRRQVDGALAEFLDAKEAGAAALGHPLAVTRAVRGFLDAGGKRIRPLLCLVGWHAADSSADSAPVVRAAAALEMFVAFALIHDDIMDGSDSRRGQPSVHRAFATEFGHRRDAEQAGASSALLIGNFALIWCEELLHTAGLPAPHKQSVHALFDTMLEEVMFGQFRDLLGGEGFDDDVEAALEIIRYKTATGTFVRPLQIGAAAAGADGELLNRLAALGMPLGEAFQLRDDLLGVFGRPDQTGKPNLDDLREGKHTVLLALALRNATPTQRHVLESLVGQRDLDHQQADRIRTVLETTGARNQVEQMISERFRHAEQVIDTAAFPPPAAAALRQLALASTTRTA